MKNQDLRRNLLPKDGQVFLQDEYLPAAEAIGLFDSLIALPEWQADSVKMFGKVIVTGRKVIWFGDAGCSYTYSGVEKQPEPWSELVLSLKARVEQATGQRFNSCLANLYHHGDEGMGWHSDDEPELGDCPHIAVVSLGAERKFKLKHKGDKSVVDLFLQNGSLLVMQGRTQESWWHSLPKSKKVSQARISLTFRSIKK